MRRSLITVIIAACCTCACEPDYMLPDVGGEGEYREVLLEIVSGDDPRDATRSSIVSDLRNLNTVDIFVYDSGVLRRSLCTSRNPAGGTSASVTMKLIIGNIYDIVVVANNVNHEPPASLNAVLYDMMYEPDGMSSMLENGVPMAGRATVTVSKSTSCINVELTRLAAMVILMVDDSDLTEGNIEFTSAKVRQMNAVCPFFSDGVANAGDGVVNGDIATDNDLYMLNHGWAPVFFILENRQGTLLPGNTDPDKKTPSELVKKGKDPELCTYIEICGIYTKRNGSIPPVPFTARFFLGSDACTNFDVNRNWIYEITLYFTDGVCLRKDWKMNCTYNSNLARRL